MRWARWRVVLALTVLMLSWALPAGATSQNRVVLLTTESEPDLIALELAARLRGELQAAELEVIVQPVMADADLRIAVESSNPELAPAAVIAVRYLRPTAAEAAGAEVWISDRLSSSTLMQVVRLNSQQGNPAARLAVQVAEVLKARLALLWVKPEPPPPPPISLPPPPPAPPAPIQTLPTIVTGFSWAWDSVLLTTREEAYRAGFPPRSWATSCTETTGRLSRFAPTPRGHRRRPLWSVPLAQRTSVKACSWLKH